MSAKTHAALVEHVAVFETGGIVHPHPRSEAPIPETRLVAHIAVADAHEVTHTVA